MVVNTIRALIVAVAVAVAFFFAFQSLSSEGTISEQQLPVLIAILVGVALVSSFLGSTLVGSQAESAGSGFRRQSGTVVEEDIEDGRERGVVKWFNVKKGFGFITWDEGEDVFVHFRSIRGQGHRSLNEGQRVKFTVSHGDKGPQAEDVSAIR